MLYFHESIKLPLSDNKLSVFFSFQNGTLKIIDRKKHIFKLAQVCNIYDKILNLQLDKYVTSIIPIFVILEKNLHNELCFSYQNASYYCNTYNHIICMIKIA